MKQKTTLVTVKVGLLLINDEQFLQRAEIIREKGTNRSQFFRGQVQVDVDQFRCNSGYFSECHISNIFSLSKIINNKYQTLSYYGFSKKELKEFVDQSGIAGIDRIIPIGATMDFSLIWDGHNLINTLPREV